MLNLWVYVVNHSIRLTFVRNCLVLGFHFTLWETNGSLTYFLGAVILVSLIWRHYRLDIRITKIILLLVLIGKPKVIRRLEGGSVGWIEAECILRKFTLSKAGAHEIGVCERSRRKGALDTWGLSYRGLASFRCLASFRRLPRLLIVLLLLFEFSLISLDKIICKRSFRLVCVVPYFLLIYKNFTNIGAYIYFLSEDNLFWDTP